MNKYHPSYYAAFKCLAGNCPDSCCGGWEIVIDNSTLDYYKKIKGDFADKIRSSIYEDEDGDFVFSLINGRCPFLNNDNLCDIHINCGEEHTCEVCRQHPRFIEEYDGFTEISLSMSCPEAARIIFGSKLTEDTYPVPVSDKSDELLDELILYRTRVLNNILSGCDAEKCFDNLIENSLILQNETDGTDEYGYSFSDFLTDFKNDDIFEFLLKNSEILTDSWKDILRECAGKEFDTDVSLPSDYRSMLAYFVYRYYLKAINDYDIIGNALFCILSVITVYFVSEITKIPFEEAARLYSKETEHNTDNIELIKDHIADAYL